MATASNDPLDFVNRPPSRSPLPPVVRHPLGLPAGSVRALIVLMVAGLIWTLILTAREKTVEIPLYLVYLLFLILGSFFAAHGNSIAGSTAGGKSPWHLPRGSVRLLLVLGFVAVIGWRTYTTGELPEFKTDNPSLHPFLPLWLLGAFFLGVLINRVVTGACGGPTCTPAWHQDILAWVSLIAMLGLAVEVAILFLINPGLEAERRINMPHWETFLAATLGFYFGARS